MKKRMLFAFLGALLLLSGCGSSSEYAASDSAPAVANDMYKADYANEEAYVEEAMGMYDASDADYSSEPSSAGSQIEAGKATQSSSRKLIRTVNITVETKAFDEINSDINDRIVNYGGYIERMNGSYGSRYSDYYSERSCTIVARIPYDKVDEFIGAVSKEGNITYRSESTEDVTLDYVDVVSHKKMLQEELDRLLEFLDKAESIEEIITIEDRITNVKYQIDSLESRIRTYDNRVDYSVVELQIREVVDYTEAPIEVEVSPLDRMITGFKSSCVSLYRSVRDFLIDIVIDLPYLILFAIIVFIIVKIFFAILRKNGVMAPKKSKKKDKSASETVISEEITDKGNQISDEQ
ncbi:MAG: DUF4349 domain-containing protein [Lachnospiraceae bacterium]|nr:DUF4349 domain-containing protein [Lachnospiraceae bacterium]